MDGMVLFLWLYSRICGYREALNLGALPPSPRNFIAFWPEWQLASTTIEALERRIGLRRNATRAPTQAPEWQGRLQPPQM